jgi:uncharacterized protein (TIGR02996 family)
MLGLTLRGDARPTRLTTLGAGVDRLPAAYVELMTTWGPGRLCGAFELPDPGVADGRFEYLQNQFRVQAPALRLRGQWAQLTDDELAHASVLGVDARGFALLARDPRSVALLHPRGDVQPLETFERFIAALIAGHSLGWSVNAPYRAARHDAERAAPAIFVTTEPSAVSELFDALVDGDEPGADAALAEILETEVVVFAMLELMSRIAGAAGKAIAAERRASYAEQCFRLARRKATELVSHVQIREIKRVLAGGGELPAELLGQITGILEPAAGIFAGEADPTEAALLDALAATPHDAATRLVYADHLEERGELARAEALRAEAATPPIADAADRGFIAPAGVAPVDGARQLEDHVARWRAEDPSAPIDALVTRIEALHPTARQGYALLLTQLVGWEHGAGARLHLEREIRDCWPQLVLALRGADRGSSLALLVDRKIREAAPFLLSLIRRPSPHATQGGQLAIAEAFGTLGKLTPALVDELVPCLAGDGADGADAPRVSRLVAARMLQDSASDDRVFEAYLDAFCELHPHSEHALKKRRKDPRVEATLLEVLAREEKASLRDGRHLAYTTSYGLVARYLGRLGNARGKEAAQRYKRFTGWGRERVEDM